MTIEQPTSRDVGAQKMICQHGAHGFSWASTVRSCNACDGDAGLYVPDVSMETQAIVKGDSLIDAIGAASILAKVLRDNEMDEMDALYPGYGFAKHKGYPTAFHRNALMELGPCDIHRRSYAPVMAALAPGLVSMRT